MQRHLRFGWWTLLVFLTMGLVLEILHGFKAEAYLKVSNETRRLMWTLAHAHGTLLGLVNIAFAMTVRSRSGAQVLIKARSRLVPSLKRIRSTL
jgi:hypothetical protein